MIETEKKPIMDGPIHPGTGMEESVDAKMPSIEGHVSHMLSDRMSSRCMGWERLKSPMIAPVRMGLEAYQKKFASYRKLFLEKKKNKVIFPNYT